MLTEIYVIKYKINSVVFSIIEFNFILSILATEIPALNTEIYKGYGDFY